MRMHIAYSIVVLFSATPGFQAILCSAHQEQDSPFLPEHE
jgi:hypothetical protein